MAQLTDSSWQWRRFVRIPRLFTDRYMRYALVATGAILTIGYLVAFAFTYTDRVAQIPTAAWSTHNLVDIHRDIHADSRIGVNGELYPSLYRDAGIAAAPHAVTSAAARWVDAINAQGPNAILEFMTDSIATLYLVPGAWWGSLTRDQHCLWVDQYGERWRSYLRSTFGSWERRDGFDPGVIVFDTLGEAARSMNGHVVCR